MQNTNAEPRPFFTGRFAQASSLIIATVLLAALPVSRAFANIDIAPLYQVQSSSTTVGQLMLANNTDAAKVYQIRAFAWTLDANGQEVVSPTSDIRFSPSQVTLPPQGRQIVRYLRAPSASKGEIRYRIVAQEISAPQINGSGLGLLLKLDFPWIFRAASDKPVLNVTRDGSTLVIRNDGNATAQLSTISAGETVLVDGLVGYVLPGEEQRIALPSAAAGEITALVNGERIPLK
jgi:fimbrial chaperone protein